MSYISDLPSSGDTAYEGVVIRNDRLYASYYSNDLKTDNAWILGMLTPTDIYMINMSISSILDAADHPIALINYLPWDNYLIVGINGIFSIIIIRYCVRKQKK
jgi:hypothetical protein